MSQTTVVSYSKKIGLNESCELKNKEKNLDFITIKPVI